MASPLSTSLNFPLPCPSQVSWLSPPKQMVRGDGTFSVFALTASDVLLNVPLKKTQNTLAVLFIFYYYSETKGSFICRAHFMDYAIQCSLNRNIKNATYKKTDNMIKIIVLYDVRVQFKIVYLKISNKLKRAVWSGCWKTASYPHRQRNALNL